MIFEEIPRTQCPWCGVRLRAAACMNAPGAPIREGSKTLCMVCVRPMVFEGGSLRKLGYDELMTLPHSTQTVIAIEMLRLKAWHRAREIERGTEAMAHPAGIRVGAMRSADKEKVYMFGWGVYEGDFVPDEAAGFGAEMAREAGRTNPRIRLDDGTVVYGCECWWGPVADVEASIQGREVVTVSIEEARAMWHAEKAAREGKSA